MLGNGLGRGKENEIELERNKRGWLVKAQIERHNATYRARIEFVPFYPVLIPAQAAASPCQGPKVGSW